MKQSVTLEREREKKKKQGKKAAEIAVVARRLPEAALILAIPYFSSYGRCIRDRGFGRVCGASIHRAIIQSR